MNILSMPSVHYEPRPPEIEVETIIIHTMHNPECRAEGRHLELAECKRCLDELALSAHYLIGREGEIWNLVPEEMKAWHAGESSLPHDQRTGVNAFSIGIELAGAEDADITPQQYDALAELCVGITRRHPITSIYGHSDIAPKRKSDPWNFNWLIFQEKLRALDSSVSLRLPLGSPA